MNGATNRLVVMQGNRISDVDITMAADKQRTIAPDDPLVAAARAVGTCFGDRPTVVSRARDEADEHAHVGMHH